MIRRRHAAIHRNYFIFRDVQLGRDMLNVFGFEVAFFNSLNLALDLTQIEKQLLLCRRGADFHQRPRPQDIFLDRRPDPPHGIGRKPKAAFRIKALDRLHHAHIAFRNQLGDGQSIAPVAHGDFGDKAQMTSDHFVCGFRIFVLGPCLGEHIFLILSQHRKFANILQIAR